MMMMTDAGSSLEGHISATFGGVSIDLTGMNKILTVRNGEFLKMCLSG